MPHEEWRINADGPKPEVPLVTGGQAPNADRRTAVVLLGVVAVAVAAAVLGIFLNSYNRQWEKAREGWKVETSHGPYLKVRKAFLADIEADRLDEAFAATTASYRGTYGRAKFDETAARFREFRKRPGAHNENRGREPMILPIQLGPAPPKDAKPKSISVSGFDYWKADDGSRLRLWISVQQPEDSFLLRHPPPIGVDSFKAEYVDAKGDVVPLPQGKQ